MTVKEVKKTLANEAELLQHMINAVNGFDGSKFTRQAQFIKDSWAIFLNDRRQTNVSLADTEDDDEVVEDLSQEMQQVQQYIDVTDKTAAYTETWKKFLTCERDILKYLVNMDDKSTSSPSKE